MIRAFIQFLRSLFEQDATPSISTFPVARGTRATGDSASRRDSDPGRGPGEPCLSTVPRRMTPTSDNNLQAAESTLRRIPPQLRGEALEALEQHQRMNRGPAFE